MYHTETAEPEMARNFIRDTDPRDDADLLEQARAEAQRSRTYRALTEEAGYVFATVRNSAGQPFVQNGGAGLCVAVRTLSGACYLVDEEGCTCPDSKAGAALRLGVKCKHFVSALPVFRRARQAREDLLHSPRDIETAEAEERARRASARRDAALLFDPEPGPWVAGSVK